eukprot:715127-Amphidinium_carterae.1
MAERCVVLMKTAVRRLLVAANLGDRFWPYAVHFAAQLQQAKALGYPWDQPMFGELVATWRLQSSPTTHLRSPEDHLASFSKSTILEM